MRALVTIAIPVYKRLHYLPVALEAVRAQDYPEIELIVSDNGRNGPTLRDVVDRHYSRPYTLRHTESEATIPGHFNQLVAVASGQYFLWLADDDQISPDYVSELVSLLESVPRAAVALAPQETIDETGHVLRRSSRDLPSSMPGVDFIEAWCGGGYGFECFSTFLARTRDIRTCGGFPEFATGTHSDNALLVKLCLTRDVAFGRTGTFRWRFHDSHGWAIGCKTLATASREFVEFLKVDPQIESAVREYGEPMERARQRLIRMAWETYLWRWKQIYRSRLSYREWWRAGFALPYIPAYYRKVARTLAGEAASAVVGRLKRRLPRVYQAYRTVRHRG